MLLAAGAWLWGMVGPWFWWVWGPVAIGLNGFLKMCGVMYLFERLGKWWRGE
jgi:hypothetical protein